MKKDPGAELDRLRPYLIKKFEQWLQEQHRLYLPIARPLSSDVRSRLSGYFERRTLDSVRVATVEGIRNPDFYGSLERAGIPVPLDFSTAVGLTVIDLILIREELVHHHASLVSTIFHEMVHIVQIDILGLKRHIELYADSLREGGYQYHSVVLERQAYTLGNRFDRGEPPFSVEKVVRQELERYE
ncbi:MAG TPA: hypothetical protein EYP71_01015 [Dehalococcoidia bacterium]|nr:hypothetical protein [Dehalococcoidia bacterium]